MTSEGHHLTTRFDCTPIQPLGDKTYRVRVRCDKEQPSGKILRSIISTVGGSNVAIYLLSTVSTLSYRYGREGLLRFLTGTEDTVQSRGALCTPEIVLN